MMSALKLFLTLVAALAGATAMVVAVHYAAPGATQVQWGADQIDWVGNLSFALLIALFVLRVRSVRLAAVGTAVAVAAFLAFTAGVVRLGGEMLEQSSTLGLFMISPVGTIGSYPFGTDMPFTDGITQWAATALVPIGVGLLLGLSARGLRRA